MKSGPDDNIIVCLKTEHIVQNHRYRHTLFIEWGKYNAKDLFEKNKQRSPYWEFPQTRVKCINPPKNLTFADCSLCAIHANFETSLTHAQPVSFRLFLVGVNKLKHKLSLFFSKQKKIPYCEDISMNLTISKLILFATSNLRIQFHIIQKVLDPFFQNK